MVGKRIESFDRSDDDVTADVDREALSEEVICPLPVIRKHYDEAGEGYDLTFEKCGEPVWIETEQAYYIDPAGKQHVTTGSTWKAACQGGHVLLLPDHGSDDNYDLIPWQPSNLTLLRSLFAGVPSAPATLDTRARRALIEALPMLRRTEKEGMLSCSDAARKALVNDDQHDSGCLLRALIAAGERLALTEPAGRED